MWLCGFGTGILGAVLLLRLRGCICRAAIKRRLRAQIAPMLAMVDDAVEQAMSPYADAEEPGDGD